VQARFRLRQLVNAANLSTVAGLGVAKALGASLEAGPDGLVLARGAGGSFPRAAAFTLGNVVVLRTDPGPDLLRHEARHATQWAWCVVLFLPLYAAAVAWSWIRTGDHWSRNIFEQRAGLAEGGYRANPTRRDRRRSRQSG
jgi:hypothetical protein